MSTHRSYSTAEIHSTEAGGVRAAWRRDGRDPQIMFLDDPSSDRPARRWPDEPMPTVAAGHIAFDPGAYPSLTTVRELLPEYVQLWDAVAADFRDSLMPARTPDCAATQHAAFFALPASI